VEHGAHDQASIPPNLPLDFLTMLRGTPTDSGNAGHGILCWIAMTRFKELRRIQEAIEHKDQTELQWALGYCQMRCKAARVVYSLREQEKYWRQMEQKVRAAIENSN